MCIICQEHGEFWQTPSDNLQGHGCSFCKKENFSNAQNEKKIKCGVDFCNKAISVHGEYYDYSKVEYKGNNIKVIIGCPKHGWFKQTAADHLSGHGCNKCGREKTDEFLNRIREQSKNNFEYNSNKIHNNFYNYSKVNYINANIKVCVTCPKHGEFWISPSKHLCGQGCPKCKSSHLENDMRHLLEENNIKYVEQYRSKWLGR